MAVDCKSYIDGQAFAVWQWFNMCFDRLPAVKGFVRLNFDETGICYFQNDWKSIKENKRRQLLKVRQKSIHRMVSEVVGGKE